MSDEKNFSAFPCAAFGPGDDMIHQRGMTIRDWFAGQALSSILHNTYLNDRYSERTLAEISYEYADEMIKARSK